MDFNKPETASPADWNSGENSGMNPLPPPYQEYNTAYNPHPGGFHNMSGYPQPYGIPYGHPYQGLYQGGPAVTIQPAVCVTSSLQFEPSPDHLSYSIFTMLCCFFPLGIAALIFSVKTQDANRARNTAEAEKYSRLAYTFSNFALRVGVAVISFSIFLTILVFVMNP